MSRHVRWMHGVALALLLASTGIPGVVHAQSASALMAAAVSVDIQDGGGKTLRTVNATLLRDGVVVPLESLAGANRATVRARDGSRWTCQNVLSSNAVIGLALLQLPETPAFGASLPQSGSFNPGSKATVLGGPDSRPDSVTTTCYFTYSMRDRTDFIAVSPGLPGAAPLVDRSGRLLGVVNQLSAGGIDCHYAVPAVSVKTLVTNRGDGQAISTHAQVTAPPFAEPSTALGISFRGANLVTANQYEPARTLLNAALKRDPKYPEAHYWLGRLLFAEQKHEEAAQEFVEAGTSDPGYHMAWHMAGAAYNQAARYLDAEKMYYEALKANPRSAETYCNLGGAYFNQNRYDKAVEAFRKSIELDPRYRQGLAYHNLVQVHLTQGRRTEAEGVYQDLLKINPEWARRLRSTLDSQP